MKIKIKVIVGIELESDDDWPSESELMQEFIANTDYVFNGTSDIKVLDSEILDSEII